MIVYPRCRKCCRVMTRTSLPRMLRFFPAELASRHPDTLTFCCAVCGILAVEKLRDAA